MPPDRDTDWSRQLAGGLASMQIELDQHRQRQLLLLLRELLRWNRAYNLTATTDPQVVVSRHLLDSLAVLPWLSGRRAIDLGSGAGLPGLPLAIAEPGRHWDLVDSAGKRVRFMRHAVRRLGLENAAVHHCRIEAFEPAQPADEMTARAVAPLQRLLAAAGVLLDAGTRLLLMCDRSQPLELHDPDARYTLRGLHPLAVPGQPSSRQLAVFERNRSHKT